MSRQLVLQQAGLEDLCAIVGMHVLVVAIYLERAPVGALSRLLSAFPRCSDGISSFSTAGIFSSIPRLRIDIAKSRSCA
jgi:hypothetical protein